MKPNLHSKITAETSLQANLTPTGQLTTERPAPSSSSRLTLDAATPPHYLHWPSPTQFVLSPAKQAHGPVSSAPAGAPCVKDAFGMSAGNKPLPTSAFASSGKFDAFPVEGVTRLHSLKAASPFTGAVASLGHPSTLHSSGGRSVASSESRLGKYFLLTRPTAPAEGAFGGLTRPGSGARYAGHDVCSELCLSGTLTEKLNRRTSQHEALVERVWGGGSVRGADVRHAHHDAGSFRTDKLPKTKGGRGQTVANQDVLDRRPGSRVKATKPYSRYAWRAKRMTKSHSNADEFATATLKSRPVMPPWLLHTLNTVSHKISFPLALRDLPKHSALALNHGSQGSLQPRGLVRTSRRKSLEPQRIEPSTALEDDAIFAFMPPPLDPLGSALINKPGPFATSTPPNSNVQPRQLSQPDEEFDSSLFTTRIPRIDAYPPVSSVGSSVISPPSTAPFVFSEVPLCDSPEHNGGEIFDAALRKTNGSADVFGAVWAALRPARPSPETKSRFPKYYSRLNPVFRPGLQAEQMAWPTSRQEYQNLDWKPSFPDARVPNHRVATVPLKSQLRSGFLGAPDPLVTNTAIEDAVAAANRDANTSNHVRFCVPSSPSATSFVSCSPSRLSELLHPLILESIDRTEHKGEFSVQVCSIRTTQTEFESSHSQATPKEHPYEGRDVLDHECVMRTVQNMDTSYNEIPFDRTGVAKMEVSDPIPRGETIAIHAPVLYSIE